MFRTRGFMSSDESPRVPAKRDRREAVREKAQQVHVRQSRHRVLRRVLLGAAGVVVVGGIAGGMAWALGEMGSEPQLQPANAEADGFRVTAVTGMAAAQAMDARIDSTPTPEALAEEPEETAEPTPAATETSAVDIRIYVDYLSEQARDFQLANAEQLTKWVDQDAATLSYYPVAMLTAKSNGTQYSLRAASAAACVATHSPDAFYAFNNALLRDQPAIDSDGLSDAEIATVAQASGVAEPRTVRECIEERSFASWARAATDRALESIPDTDGVSLTGTPMILVNGTPYVGALDDPTEFAQFVISVSSDAYYRTPSPTPTPSTTPTDAP
jgi:protein-disulfide isomerase